MRIYVASKSRHWPFWSALKVVGLPISASWIDWHHNTAGTEPTPEEWSAHSDTCLREAAAADVLLLYAQEDERQFGCLLECGAALASGRTVYLVSPHPWPFLRNHPRVVSFDRLDQAVAAIAAITNELKGAGRLRLAIINTTGAIAAAPNTRK